MEKEKILNWMVASIPWTYPSVNLPYRDSFNIPSSKFHVHFPLPRSFTRLHPSTRPYLTFCNKLVSYSEELLAPCPTPKLEDHPLPAIHCCSFSIFAATLHIWRLSPLSTTQGCAMLWWQVMVLSNLPVLPSYPWTSSLFSLSNVA